MRVTSQAQPRQLGYNRSWRHASMRTSVLILGFTVLFALHASPSGAQVAHSAPQSAIDAALQQKVASETGDRETVLRLLDRPDVQAVANNAGIDFRAAKDAVATLDGKEIAEIAAHASQVEQALTGGQSKITIS